MAREVAIPAGIPVPDLGDFVGTGGFDFQGYDAACAEFRSTLAAQARKNGKSDLLGEVVKWQRADGFAEYVVWRTRPLELIHLPLGDAWQVEAALMRGLRLAEVTEMVNRSRAVRALIAKRQAEREEAAAK